MMAASKYKGDFALVPVAKHGRVKGALGWDTEDEAQEFLVKFLEGIPSADQEKFRQLKPEIVRCMTAN